jgi:hypothetical protein
MIDIRNIKTSCQGINLIFQQTRNNSSSGGICHRSFIVGPFVHHGFAQKDIGASPVRDVMFIACVALYKKSEEQVPSGT